MTENYVEKWWKNFTENFWRAGSGSVADSKPKQKKVALEKETVNEKAGFVYLLKSSNGYHKIGKAKKVNDRISSWKRFFPVRIDLVCYIACHDRAKVENFLHKHFWKKRVEGEWYKLDKDDVSWMKGLKDYELG